MVAEIAFDNTRSCRNASTAEQYEYKREIVSQQPTEEHSRHGRCLGPRLAPLRSLGYSYFGERRRLE